jgi:hypothetical protein
MRSHCSPSPLPNLSSSSVENSPPQLIEALEENQAKILKDLSALSEKSKRNLTRTFAHQRSKMEELAMTQEAIRIHDRANPVTLLAVPLVAILAPGPPAILTV